MYYDFFSALYVKTYDMDKNDLSPYAYGLVSKVTASKFIYPKGLNDEKTLII